MKDYPLFIPPVEINQKTPDMWNMKEARIYFGWLTSRLDERVSLLLGYFNCDYCDNPQIVLKQIGEKVESAFCSDIFSTLSEGQRKLNKTGYSLAADMGLLMAKLLIDDLKEKVSWDIVTKPRSHIAYHLPVLRSDEKARVDPVGAAVAGARRILLGKENYRLWYEIYISMRKIVSLAT